MLGCLERAGKFYTPFPISRPMHVPPPRQLAVPELYPLQYTSNSK